VIASLLDSIELGSRTDGEPTEEKTFSFCKEVGAMFHMARCGGPDGLGSLLCTLMLASKQLLCVSAEACRKERV
jgi:hypothetical protein